MNREEQIFDLIESYSKGQMSIAQQEEFETLLHTNNEVRAQYEEFKDAEELMLDKFLIEEKAKMKSFDYEKALRKPGFIGKTTLFIGVLSVLLIGGLYWFLDDDASSGQKQQNSKPVEVPFGDNLSEETSPPVKQVIDRTEPEGGDVIIANNSHPIERIESINNLESTDSISFTNNTKKAEVVDETGLEDKEVHKQNKDISTSKQNGANPCLETDLRLGSLIGTNSCIGQNSGKIEVGEVRGGIKPYTMEIDKINYTGSVSNIENLKAGNYDVRVMDSLGCDITKTVTVGEVCCTQDYTLDLIFSWSESYDEFTWPSICNQSYYVSILTRSGEEKLKELIRANESTTWDGRDSKGNQLSPGYYILLYKLESGEILRKGLNIL